MPRYGSCSTWIPLQTFGCKRKEIIIFLKVGNIFTWNREQLSKSQIFVLPSASLGFQNILGGSHAICILDTGYKTAKDNIPYITHAT